MEKELRYSRKRPRVRAQKMDSGPRATNGATRFEGLRSLRRELPNTKNRGHHCTVYNWETEDR